MSVSKKPAYLLHKATGQARVRVNGKDVYLGRYGSPESREKYDDLIREFFRSCNLDQYRMTLDDLTIQYLDFALTYYVKNGQATSEVDCIRYALRPLVKLFGTRRCRDFGPLLLKQYRDELIRLNLARKTINGAVERIRRMFRWAVGNEILPAELHQALAAVSGLRAGRSAARESAPVQPVREAIVNATIDHLPDVVAAMVRLQMLTGCRPGELCSMRPCDVTFQSNGVWVYRPEHHKTEHHGKDRRIFVGPEGQAVLRPYLDRDAEAYCFSPTEAVEQQNTAKRSARKSPMTPSQTARQPKPDGKRRPRERYDKNGYCRAIVRACEMAFDMPAELRKIPRNIAAAERERLQKLAAEWRAKNCWSPNQLRHTRATRIREKYGIEAAATVLGHSDPRVTEIYAERDFEMAARIMREVG